MFFDRAISINFLWFVFIRYLAEIIFSNSMSFSYYKIVVLLRLICRNMLKLFEFSLLPLSLSLSNDFSSSPKVNFFYLPFENILTNFPSLFGETSSYPTSGESYIYSLFYLLSKDLTKYSILNFYLLTGFYISSVKFIPFMNSFRCL